jgi:hydroxymethylglutaryl-CoA lyase/(R)-citramalyl-CoA lyase
MRRTAATTLDRVNCTLATTETFNAQNGNATLDEAVRRVRAIVEAAEKPVTITVSCAFGCPFEGEVDPGAVAALCERLAGADELVLADTIGVATPTRVRRLVERVSILGPRVGAHLHNTRNTGYASAWAALDGGASVLDASIGGLGGCPFSPNATGNIATEDLVWQLERDGVRTGVDVSALVEVSAWLEGVLGRRLEGYLYRAARWP